MFLPTPITCATRPPLLSCDRVEADLLWQWSFLGVSAFSAAYSIMRCCYCSTTWEQAGISLYQARTGEGLDLSECIDSQAATYAGAVPLPWPLPHSHSLMGPAVTTDPNCL